MTTPGALTIALALAASPGGDRLLLCRAKVLGDAALARAEALVEAGRRNGRFLDYGVDCGDPAESARAARRAGLAHAIFASADGGEGSRYVLVLSDAADEAKRAERTVEVAAGADAVRPLRSALSSLVETLPRGPGPRPARIAAWVIAGAGAAALTASAVFAAKARAAADRASSAADPDTYARARADWKDANGTTGILLGAGGAALAAGLTLRFAF
jgi:hypothetical protein